MNKAQILAAYSERLATVQGFLGDLERQNMDFRDNTRFSLIDHDKLVAVNATMRILLQDIREKLAEEK